MNEKELNEMYAVGSAILMGFSVIASLAFFNRWGNIADYSEGTTFAMGLLFTIWAVLNCALLIHCAIKSHRK